MRSKSKNKKCKVRLTTSLLTDREMSQERLIMAGDQYVKFSLLSNSLIAHVRILTVFLLVDGIFFSCTSPATNRTFLIIIAGSLLVVTVYLIVRFVVSMFAYAYPITIRAQRVLCVLIAALLLFVIFMRSIGQLHAPDFLGLLPIVVLTYFYSTYGDRAAILPGRMNANHK
jgi:hypothetical protein